eukprot:1687017-Amphidinium_carterae.1
MDRQHLTATKHYQYTGAKTHHTLIPAIKSAVKQQGSTSKVEWLRDMANRVVLWLHWAQHNFHAAYNPKLPTTQDGVHSFRKAAQI